MQTPWDQPPPPAPSPSVDERGPALQEVKVRFGVTLSSPARANVFAMQFRAAYSRSGATVIGDTAWLIFRCGAIDGHEAALQAAVAVNIIARHKLVRELPRAVHLHDFEVAGRVHDSERARAAYDREASLRKAMAWGLLHDPLVENAAAAQLVGRLSPPDRRPIGQRAAVGERTAARPGAAHRAA